MLKEIEKIETQLKKERLIDKSTEDHEDSNSEKYNYLHGKINKQNTQLGNALRTGKEITTTQNLTFIELQNQKQKLMNANKMVGEVEQTLSLHDQLVGVINNRELFNKLKLVAIVAMLFIADCLVVYVKFG
jgi:hypothetical protein